VQVDRAGRLRFALPAGYPLSVDVLQPDSNEEERYSNSDEQQQTPQPLRSVLFVYEAVFAVLLIVPSWKVHDLDSGFTNKQNSGYF
jgi:hypothetical protein